MRVSAFVQFSILPLALVSAHPGEVHGRMSPSELAHRQSSAHRRHAEARNCAPQVAAYQSQRKAKRNALRKREISGSHAGLFSAVTSMISGAVSRLPSKTGSASPPRITNIQNFTCVTAPEVTEGPYYINNEFVRHDLTEEQSGIKLVLDIGVLDTISCEPLDNVLVELWSANATGVYGSYGTTLSNRPGPSPGGPPRRGPPGRGGGGPRGSPPMTRNETFLRGGWQTNENGIVELTTIFPGFYAGRAPHIHTMVHKDWVMSENGTLVSHSGTVVHNGQFFFHEKWNDMIYAERPYTDNKNRRTLNKDDHILSEENADGNNAFLELELLGESLADGILGYITMGVNSSASYDIHNTNYLKPSALDTEVTGNQEPFSVFATALATLEVVCASVLSTASSIHYGAQKAWIMAVVSARRVLF
ncbi:hypothetical protein PILCRDRAFT_819495 [Piloderma croceum F 1598]|uniref:Intradiol ring-cleavage dioxygenases domain-containing protein n=1 Tax=Piloderma croceum (strain F 1598) TaxID=765440 RepID=A0A0C3C105_PILCF|nr:hypothetical protein PILCRDRAFT_819495 [Piloderma croceum F 1598]